MQTFHKLFSGKPSSSSMSAELNAQIITVNPTRLQHHTHLWSILGFIYLIAATYCLNLIDLSLIDI